MASLSYGILKLSCGSTPSIRASTVTSFLSRSTVRATACTSSRLGNCNSAALFRLMRLSSAALARSARARRAEFHQSLALRQPLPLSRIDSVATRNSSVPTAVDASSGVKTKYERGETTTQRKNCGSRFRIKL